VRRGASWTAEHLQWTVAAVAGPVPVVLLPRCPGWLVAQTAAARRSVQPASSGRAWSPWSARPGCLPWRRSPVRVHQVVSTHLVASSGSDGLAVQCPAVWVSNASSVQPVRCPAVRCPAVRCPGGCCPPPSVRTRPSRLPSGGGGGEQVEAAATVTTERVEARWAAASWSGSMDGRAGPDAGDAAEVALVSGGRWRTRARWGAGAAALDRLGDQAGQAGVQSAVACGCGVGRGAGGSARGCRSGPGGGRPRDGWRPRWVVVMGPAARVGGSGRADGRACGDGRAAPARPR
jgi:hypothetical protein